ncbi:dj-1 family protein [Purpureocillium lavendulum]|uniref:Dj-1 family protein n=1 Tax=Purpureocillium lavendulum TaxID=1247861 RepID=A0AB34FVT6_9HYPO|nr:dj-1 family protein [Purpureocillium lavendulum]
MTLSVIAESAGPVSAGLPPFKSGNETEPADYGYMLQPEVHATHAFSNAPALDILLIPGGLGNMALEQNNNTSVEDFVRRRASRVEYLLSVCTGAVSLAKAGVLEGRKATTNKASWAWVTSHGTNVTWVPVARWVQDGNIWSSSGVAAGMDMTYAFLSHVYGVNDDRVDAMMNGIEYAPHTNASWDPFAVVHKANGVGNNTLYRFVTHVWVVQFDQTMERFLGIYFAGFDAEDLVG